MSCDYCERTGGPAAQTGGLGRTFSRARWSAGRTDVRAWFEERRRETGAGRPAVVAAAAAAQPLPPHARFARPATKQEAVPAIAAALQQLTGHAFRVWDNAGVGIVVAPPPTGVLRPFSAQERKALRACLGPVARRNSPYEVCLYDTGGHIPSEHQWSTAVDRLRCIEEAQSLLAEARADPGSAHLLAAGQAALYRREVTADPPAHQVVLVGWANAASLTELVLDSNGTISELPPVPYATAAESRAALERMREALWPSGALHCLGCGHPFDYPRKTCPHCGKPYTRSRP